MLSASPIGVGSLASLDVVVIVAVLDHLAVVVEAQHTHARIGEFLAFLGPAGPPFDCGPAARDDRRAEPALDILLDPEVVGEITADASPSRAPGSSCPAIAWRTPSQRPDYSALAGPSACRRCDLFS